MSRRRAFLATLLLSPIALARAQPTKPSARPARVARLRTPAAKDARSADRAFEDAMRALGWVEGENIVYDRAYADGDDKRLPALAAALVARKPDLIHLGNNPEMRAVRAAVREAPIPIVFSFVSDPVESGFVKSLRRPEGNATGLASIGWELSAKRVELLKEAMPNVRRVGVLFSPGHLSAEQEKTLIERVAGPGVEVRTFVVKDSKEIDAALAAAAGGRVEALLVTSRPIFGMNRKRILELAATHRIPVVGSQRSFADDGALISYSASIDEHLRRSAHMVDKILKGTKPGDIPVELPTKFELVVNLKTAKALSITIPQSILLQASRVIE